MIFIISWIKIRVIAGITIGSTLGNLVVIMPGEPVRYPLVGSVMMVMVSPVGSPLGV